MRRVVFIACNERVRWGGSELCWSLAAERIARSGASVAVSAKAWSTPVPQIERLRSAGCEIHLRKSQSIWSRIRRKLHSDSVFESRIVSALAKGADLAVISQGGNLDGLLWMEACQQIGIPFVVIAQAAAEQWWPDDQVAERLAIAYESARSAYFVSEANLALSRRQFVTSLKRGKVVRNPFNVSYSANPPWPSRSTSELDLACVGRLDVEAKGQDLLLGVLSLPHWRERTVHLSVVGSGINERTLPRLAESLGLRNVTFTGFVQNIEDVWSRHHLLVLPSRYEGMPLALVEAMLCSRPSIVTDVAGHCELIRDGINGFLAKAPTAVLLDEAMNRAWSLRDNLRRMGSVAGDDVRRWVSADPTEDFVRELTRAAEGIQKS